MQDAQTLLERAFTDAFGADEAADELSERILDAANELFCRIGMQRSTMDDVARRAGVSRITVYRRFATKEALVEHTIRREFRRYFDQFLVDIAPAKTADERVVLGFVSSLRTMRGNPLIASLFADDPTLLMPSLVGDQGRTLAAVRRFLAAQLRFEQRAGHIPGDIDPDLVAEIMVRICTSFLVIPSHIIDIDDDEQLRAIARQFLVPMLRPPPETGAS